MKKLTDYPASFGRRVAQGIVENHARGVKICAWYWRIPFPDFVDLLCKYAQYNQLQLRITRELIHAVTDLPKGTPKSRIDKIVGEILHKYEVALCEDYVKKEVSRKKLLDMRAKRT